MNWSIIFRRILTLALFSGFLVALYDSIKKLCFEPPMGITFEKKMKSHLPRITACPFKHNLIQSKILSFEDLMTQRPSLENYVTFSYNDTESKEVIKGEDLTEEVVMFSFGTVLNKCLMFKTPRKVQNMRTFTPYNPMIMIEFAEDIPFSVFLTFHDEDMYPGDPKTRSAGPSFVRENSNLFSEYQLKMMTETLSPRALNKMGCKENALEEDPNECINDRAKNEMNCSLPWWKNDPKGRENCKTNEHFKEFIQFMNTSATKCISLKCILNSWEYKNTMRVSEDNDPLNYTTAVRMNGSMYFFYLETVEVSVMNHVVMYNMSQFIADFGGFLGLLLGASVLSIYDEVIEVLRWIKEKLMPT